MSTITKDDLRTFVREIFDDLAEKREDEIRRLVEAYGRRTVENKLLGAPVRAFDPEREVKERMGEFFKAVLSGRPGGPGGGAVTRDLAEGTDSAGGYLVPDDFVGELVKRLPELSELYPYVRKFTVARDTGNVPRLSTDVTATWTTTENTDQGETNPAFDQISWQLKKLTMYTDVSNDLLEDAAVDVAEEITQLFVEKAAAERDRVITVGDGSTEPAGVFSATIIQSVSVGTLSYDKLVDIEMALPKKYRAKARWIMSGTNVKRCMKLKDSDSRPLFTRDPSGAHPPTLLGYQISQQEDAPDGQVLLGDLGRYLWFGRRGMSVATDSSGAAFKADQTTIRFKERADGILAIEEAFALGKDISG